MKKTELTQRIARRSGVTRAEAADRLDRLVCQIVIGARRGKPPVLPGFGVFELDGEGHLQLEREGEKKHDGK